MECKEFEYILRGTGVRPLASSLPVINLSGTFEGKGK